MADSTAPLFDTLAPEAISEELSPVIAELGLEGNCRELAENGWTVVENAASEEFNARFRETILRISGGSGGANMLLAKDPIFTEAITNPNLMALAEFSVGRGFLISQVAASVRPKGAPAIGLPREPLAFHASPNRCPPRRGREVPLWSTGYPVP